MSVLIFQIILLIVLSYLVGCVLGALFAKVFSKKENAALMEQSSQSAPQAASVSAQAVQKTVEPMQASDEIDAQLSGTRPAALAAPRGGKADDLEKIKGIGPVNVQRLNALGIYHFDQIASWTGNEIEWVGGFLKFPGRIEREEWVEQAKKLVS